MKEQKKPDPLSSGTDREESELNGVCVEIYRQGFNSTYDNYPQLNNGKYAHNTMTENSTRKTKTILKKKTTQVKI